MKKFISHLIPVALMFLAAQAQSAKLSMVEAIDLAESLKPGEYLSVEYFSDGGLDAYFLSGYANGEMIEIALDANTGLQLEEELLGSPDFDVDLDRAIAAALEHSQGELIAVHFMEDDRPLYLVLVSQGKKLINLDIDARTLKVIRSETCEDCDFEEMTECGFM